MGLFTKRSSIVEAVLWNKNGDHPEDYVSDVQGFENGELRTFTGEERKAKEWEGSFVGYFRHPDIPGTKVCSSCNKTMHEHGWIDRNGPNGITVCPGNYIVSNDFSLYTVNPEAFKETFVPVEE